MQNTLRCWCKDIITCLRCGYFGPLHCLANIFVATMLHPLLFIEISTCYLSPTFTTLNPVLKWSVWIGQQEDEDLYFSFLLHLSYIISLALWICSRGLVKVQCNNICWFRLGPHWKLKLEWIILSINIFVCSEEMCKPKTSRNLLFCCT